VTDLPRAETRLPGRQGPDGDTDAATPDAENRTPDHRDGPGQEGGRPEERPRERTRRGPGPFTLLVLPGLVALVGVAGFLALTGVPALPWTKGTNPQQDATSRIDSSYLPWLRKAAAQCTVLTPSLLAAQIDQLSGWDDDSGQLSGGRGIAAFTDAQWHTWGKDDDGDGRSTPTDPADAIMALGRQDCALAGKVTDLRTAGTVNGDLVDLTLAARAVGVDAVKEAGRTPAMAQTYLKEVKALLPRYTSLDQEESQDAAGSATGSALGAPLRTTLTVTSPFGSRKHPLTGVTKLHTGVDFAATQGTQVYAAAAGKVVFAAMTSAYGNRIVIDHGTVDGKRLETTYSHLSGLQVAAGQTVAAGTPIGLVGSTGLSTGPHLHFEVILDGNYTDPVPWLTS
jgi:murein DD-endopeptidase MepM/ murein hydrolase activator NlpD